MQKIIHTIRDHKMEAGFFKEKNDCSVVAFVNTTGIHYSEAHRLMENHGRKNKEGAYTHCIRNAMATKPGGKTFKKVAHIGADPGQRKVTIATWAKYHGTGTWYCFVTGHVFAMVDGVVMDTGFNRPGTRIDEVYQVVD